MIGRPCCACEGHGLDHNRRIGEERTLEFMELPALIEQGEVNRPRTCEVNRIRSESKILRDDVHRLNLTIAARVAGAEHQHRNRQDRSSRGTIFTVGSSYRLQSSQCERVSNMILGNRCGLSRLHKNRDRQAKSAR